MKKTQDSLLIKFLAFSFIIALFTHCPATNITTTTPSITPSTDAGHTPTPPPTPSAPTVALIPPTPGDVGIPIESNCSTLSTPALVDACNSFMANEAQFVFPSLEDISGGRFRDCLDRVRFEFNAGITNLGQAYQDGRTGIIQFNTQLTQQYFEATPPLAFDDHEPVHLLYQCMHISNNLNIHHVFFFGVQAELNATIFERSGHALTLASDLATTNRNNLNYWYINLSNDRSGFGASTGMFAGCPGVTSYLLFGEYLRPNHDIVRTWFTTIHDDPILATLPYASTDADRRFVDLTVNLINPNDTLRSQLSPYCDISRH